MNKDIIYIDVEDDVTSVIGKVRASKEKIVALVPPKNIGSLQSAVNLRLLSRAADNAGKRLVLITNNSGLTALAAGVKIPVAKNLQSKPEIPEVAATTTDADEDIIKGDELPVGELAAATGAAEATVDTGTTATGAPKPSDDDITITDLPDLDKEAPIAAAAAVGSAKKAKAAHGSLSKVPNFSRFRKWIFIGGGLIVAIILFFVLGNIFFTSAKVVITAQTSNVPVSQSLTVTTTGSTDTDTSTIKAVTKQVQKTQTVTFTPTGTQNLGQKATGTVTFSSNNADIVVQGTTIPAQTKLTTSDGTVFLTDKSVTINSSNYRGASVTVTADQVGAAGNDQSGNVNGAPSGVSASLKGATSGGTDNVVTVVTDADIAKAQGQITASDSDASAAKTQLTQEFGKTYKVISESFAKSAAAPSSDPASGQQAQSAKLSVVTTYNLTAIDQNEIATFTKNYLTGQLNGKNQKIYDDGSSDATIANFTASPSGVLSLTLQATGKVGPNISDSAVKQQAAGQKIQQIRQSILAINGVKDVSVNISPFWRSTAPTADKINVSFTIAGNE